MSVGWAILLLPLGIAILVKGADWLVDGAVVIAERLGLTPLIIGLTIVAMGTSAPEVAASIAAALAGSGDIAVGNVYGSNIANLALIGGICAMIRPIAVHRAALRRDIPLMLAASFVLWPVFQNGWLSRTEAVALLAFFAAILLVTIRSERRRAAYDKKVLAELEAKIEHAAPRPPKTMGLSVLWVVLGLICLAVGAHLTVVSASALGRAVGISEAVIGLTVVAVGTSLPELTTCLVASFKGQDDLSIGNLVGSNIFNALLVIGAAGMTKPFAVSPRLAGADFWPMAAFSIAFALIALIARRISRPAGLAMLIAYGGYMGYLFLLNR
jgi:cation:H+ antiporter